MPMAVTCPRCGSKYQLDASMRGKRMRCPNTICRAVFEVRDDADPAPPVAPPEPKAQEPAPPTPPEPGAANQEPALRPSPQPVSTVEPPPKREPVPQAVEPAPPPTAQADDFSEDFPGDYVSSDAPTGPTITTEAWEPEADDEPPVRDEPVVEPIAPLPPTPAPVVRQRVLWLITAMFVMLGLVAGSAYWRLQSGLATNEAERSQKAEQLYQDQNFTDASEAFQRLNRDFPDSKDSKKYRFLAELSDVRLGLQNHESAAETEKSLERVAEFVRTYAGDALLKERETDLWQMLDFLARELTRYAESSRSQKLIDSAKIAWTAAKKYPAPPQISLAERERTFSVNWTRIEAMLATQREHGELVAALKKHIDQPTARAVQHARAMVEKTKRQDDAEIRSLLDDLLKAHREQVRFISAEPEVKRVTVADDPYPSLIVAPALKKGQVAATGDRTILSVARGVLYALDATNGDVRWARRVGVDTRHLPQRVPDDTITPELVLAFSSDQRTLTAVIVETGHILWQTTLSEACVGQPVLVDRHLLAPTVEGAIDEIELAEGRLIGSYFVGQPLTLGGVHQPGSSLVYFPADDYCLYVIDVTKKLCTNILYSKHPAGSLRGLPAIVSADKNSYLLWCQSNDLQSAQIMPFQLPIAHPDAKPVDPIVAIRDLSAPPWIGSDRVAATTRGGGLSLWGVQQKGTRDPLLFRLAKRDAGASPDFLIDLTNSAGRCEVVHVDADVLWTVMHGRLQRVSISLDPQQGPIARPKWTEPTPIGTPLHAVQTRRDASGRPILYVTTQDDKTAACLCSAINADDGKIIWQRQLGATPSQAPISVDGRILVRDRHGVLVFDPNSGVINNDERWRTSGDWLLQNQGTFDRGLMLAHDKSIIQLFWQRSGKALSVSSLTEKHTITLADTLQGTPAFGDGFLLLPLADGIVYRAKLTGEPPVSGPRWRGSGAEDQAVGHVVLLSPTDFIVTDGSRGLARYSFTDATTYKPVGKPFELRHRVTVPPVIQASEDPRKLRIVVADASDTVTLLDGDLTQLKSWSMPGKITAGPFVRADKIGCVIGKNRLVWIDPNRDGFLWEYAFGEIVGEPQVIAGVLVLADVEGRLVAIDPSTGRPAGTVVTLRANVAATAAPVPFGVDRAFVPLTDGTMLLVPIQSLRK